jgi:hypothetical protein
MAMIEDMINEILKHEICIPSIDEVLFHRAPMLASWRQTKILVVSMYFRLSVQPLPDPKPLLYSTNALIIFASSVSRQLRLDLKLTGDVVTAQRILGHFLGCMTLWWS